MKTLNLITFVSLLSCFQCLYCQKVIGNYLENQKDGLWIILDNENKKICEGLYEKGIKTGNWTYYFGDVFVSVNYQNSLPHSIWQFHYFTYDKCDDSKIAHVQDFENGEVENEYWIKWVGGYNKKGKKEGDAYCFEDKIKGTGKYKNGYKTGKWTEGNIEQGGHETGFYVRGKKDGEWTQYFGYCDSHGNYKATGCQYSVYRKGKYLGGGHRTLM